MPVLYGVAYAFLTSLHKPLIGKIKTTELPSGDMPFVFVNALVSIPFLMVAAVLMCVFGEVPHIHWPFWVFAFLTTRIQFWAFSLDVAATAEAYGQKRLSQVAPVGTFKPMLVGLFAVFVLGQSFTPQMLAGVICILGGAYAMEIRKGQGPWTPIKVWWRNRKERPFRLYAYSQLIYAFFPIPLKWALNCVHPLSPFFIGMVTQTMMALMAPYGSARGVRESLCLKGLLKLFCVSALIIVPQQFVELTSYAYGNVGAMSAVFKIQVFLTMVWAWIILKEPQARSRLFGGGIMVLGTILIGL